MATEPYEPTSGISGGVPYGHLEDLLKRSVQLAEENNKLLKRMHRNSLIGFIARIIFWLFILGVPLYFLSTYLTPIINTLAPTTASSTIQSGVLGLPSVAQLEQIVKTYAPKPTQ